MKRLRQQWLSLIALSDNQIGLAFLSLLAGLASALVITLFRLAIEFPFATLLPVEHSDDFEHLSEAARIALLCGGSLLLIVIFYLVKPERRGVGVTHVLQRMESHQGYLPRSNIVLQWFAAVIAIISGHSVGREGPAIHLGAGTASQIGQSVGLAHHRLRIIAGAGVASAISASFNTPMAGVIFAMEVVLLEYNIRGFIPIILASVAGAIVSEAVFGAQTAFAVPGVDMNSLLEIPYILALGIIGGIVASGFILLVRFFQRLNPLPLWLKWGGLTAATVLISTFLPQVMGIGYDTVNDALAGNVVMGTLLGLLLAKLVLAAWAAAVGFPAGLIGPTLFIGAALGGLLGQLSAWWLPQYPVSVGFYALLGMAALMGAVLRAPLAALVALLELSANPNIIMPGMLTIVIASLVVSEVFRLPSVFEVQLGGGHNYQQPDPVQQMLRNTWVAEAMEQSFVTASRQLSPEAAGFILQREPEWLLLEEENVILPPAAVAEALSLRKEQEESGERNDDDIDLIAIPADRQPVERISLKANLQDALDLMQHHHLQWLAVYRDDQSSRCVGIVSRTHIEHFYHYQPRGR
ncbi:chloride channel protein [Thalassolituus hydrocarboniclasticus]|uniref:Chloride channel protein n=1 Tax=Thalassolituus hydrocarboniclasticus TaxID=2742796 RepID=A0ABY6A626_9GAMM|nr:chloride channel protein [Thalassolituus hydrocarboniclasticus]UXD86172.1 chloride channel protein [Thalassolituus hydrocarboniclasticus]